LLSFCSFLHHSGSNAARFSLPAGQGGFAAWPPVKCRSADCQASLPSAPRHFPECWTLGIFRVSMCFTVQFSKCSCLKKAVKIHPQTLGWSFIITLPFLFVKRIFVKILKNF